MTKTYQQKAEMIADYHDSDTDVFIQFEDCLYEGSIRVFMNKHDNSCPIFTFIPGAAASVLFLDILNDKEVDYRRTSTGKRRGVPQHRVFTVKSAIETLVNGEVYIPRGSVNVRMTNQDGREVKGKIYANDDSEERALEILVPKQQAREMAVKILPYLKQWLEP